MTRPYRPDDIEQVLDTWYRASRIVHSFLPEAFFTTERELIRDSWLPMSETIVYEVDGGVVGFLSMIGDEVGGLFVDPDYQRRGIGRQLLDDAAATRQHLELSVFEQNHGGLAFYTAYGFAVVGRQMNEDVGHPELRMRLASASRSS